MPGKKNKRPKRGSDKAGRLPKKADITLLIGTRKGLWLYFADSAREIWRVEGPHFLGHIINHVVLDPRDNETILAAASTGHLGPTMFRSRDLGHTWSEVSRPPAFARTPNGKPGRAVDHTFWLTPGHASEPGVWYAGTSPQGLFRTMDGGDNWEPFSSINDDPQYRAWMGTVQDGTPDGPKLHSINVDPRDPAHLYIAMSGGGVHESVDGGQRFTPLISGMDVVEGFDRGDATFHDPHCVRICPGNPDRLYQQNHCGIYRLDRPSCEWVHIGGGMPKGVGDIGFPMVVHPRDADTAWVFPMDGTSVWPRTSPAGRPAVYATRNGGRTWKRLDKGLPTEQAWWTVKRQAMCSDTLKSVGLYFGTTSGELWMSRKAGRKWVRIAQHLPEIYSVEAAVLA